MTWRRLTEIMARELTPAAARKVESAILRDLGGVRLSIPSSRADRPPPPSDAQLQAALRESGWNIQAAAQKLGVHPSSVYRRINRQLEEQRQEERRQQPPNPWDRLVR